MLRPVGIESSISRSNTLTRAVLETRLPGDGDGLFERTDPHLHVDRRGEVGWELEPLALERVEPAQRERDRVRARVQIHDRELPLFVRRNRAHLSIRTGLAASTVTPGRTAPEVSRTVPAITL
jgi:hypothetical protein